MCKSRAPFSCARFIMLSLSGARQISGKSVMISMRIGWGGFTEPPASFDNLERRALAMARGGAGQERADRINRLAVAPNNPANVALAQLHAEDRHFSRWDLGKHHLIGKLDKLANDELEELLHESESMRPSRFVTPSVALLVSVSRLEGRRVLPDRADFFPVRPKQPIPIIGAASDEVAVLLNQQAILVFARGDDPDVVARKKVALFPIRRVHDVDGAGRCPLGTDEINQLSVGRELQRLERRQHMVLIAFCVATAKQHRRLFAIDAHLPKLRRIHFVRAGRDFLALNLPDEHDPFAVRSEHRIGIAPARSERSRGSRFIGELDIALFDRNGLGESANRNDQTTNDEKQSLHLVVATRSLSRIERKIILPRTPQLILPPRVSLRPAALPPVRSSSASGSS